MHSRKLQNFKYSRVPNDSSRLTKFKTIHSNGIDLRSQMRQNRRQISRGEEMADVSTNKGAQSLGASIDACLCSSQLSPALAKAIETAT